MVVEMNELYHLLYNRANNVTGRCFYRHVFPVVEDTRNTTATRATYRS